MKSDLNADVQKDQCNDQMNDTMGRDVIESFVRFAPTIMRVMMMPE